MLRFQISIIITPTTSTPAFKIGEKSSDPIAMYLADLYTVQANLVGIPAISIPHGLDKESNMPIGIQFMAKPFNESLLFDISESLA